MREKMPNKEEIIANVSGLIEDLDERRRHLEAEEKKERSRVKPIPEFLYYVTTRQNAQRILREGLDPSKLIFEDREVVSLSDDPEFAFMVAEKTQSTHRTNLVLLKIETRFLTPSRIENYLRKEDQSEESPFKAAAIHEIHYDLTIPPDAIKLVKE